MPPGRGLLAKRSEASAAGPTQRPTWPQVPRYVDLALAVAVGLCALLVHDLAYVLRHPFWLDEAWVADTARSRIGITPSLASTTPLGWTVLLRMVPFGGLQRLRLVPMGFSCLAAAGAYLFGRELRLTPVATGLVTGATVLLSPAMLVRDDLKQYTADALFTVVVWVLVARVENEWRLRRVLAIGVVSALGLFFSTTVEFVGVAAIGALAAECLVKRQFRKCGQVVAVGAGMLAASALIYVLLIRPQVTRNLVNYWSGYYVPTTSASSAVSFIHSRLRQLAPYMGFHHLSVDLLLMALGVAALLWTRRYALALMMPVTLVIVIVASADRRYPFGDLRTSTFWLVTSPMLMAVGVMMAGRGVARFHLWAPALVAAAVLAVWVPTTHPYIRSHSIPNEDVRSEVRYVETHFRPGDAVIVSYAASYGYAYYFNGAKPTYASDPVGPNGHIPAYPKDPWIVVMTDRSASDVAAALARARATVSAQTGGRIWIVRSHLATIEARAWKQDLAGDNVSTIYVGPEPLLLYQPRGAAQQAG